MSATVEPTVARLGLDGRLQVSGSPDAAWPWWSFTKTVLAICALRLVEENALSLDEPLAPAPYSLRQLLQHTAGVPNYGPLPAYRQAVARGDRPWPRDDLLRRVDAARLDFPPGRGWAYSNVGYLFVRERVEAASGLNLAEAVAQFVARPLGLDSVRLAHRPSDLGEAVGSEAAAAYHPGWVYHGCLLGTAGDAVALLAALFEGRLLRADSLAGMLKAYPLGKGPPGRPWTRAGYCLGLMAGAMRDVGSAVGHSGAGPFSVSAVYRFDDLDPSQTVPCFLPETDEGHAERVAARCAAAAASTPPAAPRSP